MIVVIVSKVNWNVQTMFNVTSISLANNQFTIVGDSTQTFSEALYYVRIMG